MDLFSHLDHTERERDERQSGSRAIIAAKARSRQQFGRYIGNAGSDGERAARIGMLEGEIREVVAGACEQYEHENVEGVMESVLSHLKTACSECGCDCSDGDCKCGDCSTCNKKSAAAYDPNATWIDKKEDRCSSCGTPNRPGSSECSKCGQSLGQDEKPPKESAAHPDGCGCSFPVCVKKRDGANPDGEAEKDSEPDSDEDDKPFWESAVHDAGLRDVMDFIDPRQKPVPPDPTRVTDQERQDPYNHVECKYCGYSPGSIFDAKGGPLSSWREAAPAVVDKDNSEQETVDLPSADDSGGLGGPSPKIDKGTWKGLDPIDVGSQVHRLENQDPTDRPDYQEGPYADAKGSGGYEGSGIPDQPNLTQVDAQKVMQSPAHGDHTDVFPDGKHQADPVTSSWRILDQ